MAEIKSQDGKKNIDIVSADNSNFIIFIEDNNTYPSKILSIVLDKDKFNKFASKINKLNKLIL